MMAFQDCPGLSTLCNLFASGYGLELNSFGCTFPALITKRRFSSSSSAPDVMLSIAADQDVGLPSRVLWAGAVTAIHTTRVAVGFAISASATACDVMAPYSSGGFSTVGGNIFTDSIS